jgi:formiminotetrahydrofolate cyclodeaminase
MPTRRTAARSSEHCARKAQIAANLRELMEECGLGNKFRTPEEWIDKIVFDRALPKVTDEERQNRRARLNAMRNMGKHCPK